MPSDSGYVISAANCGNKLDFDNDTNQSVNDDLMIRLVILTGVWTNLKANRKISCHEESQECRSKVNNRDEAKSMDYM